MSGESTDRVAGNAMLVGSLPAESVETALRAGADSLSGHASMLPDGEVGPRRYFVGFVREAVLAGHPQLEEFNRPESGVVDQPDRATAEEGKVRGGEADWTFRIRPGEDLRFDDLHYGQAAIESFKVFQRLREEGVIDPHVRLQVGLASPESALNSFFDDPADWPQAHSAYASALGREIEKMLTVIPADSLAIQYELCWEVIDLSMGEENFIPFWPRLGVEEKFARHTAQLPDLAHTVPDDVLLGYHMCYGSWGGWPMTAMRDLRLCVDLANAAGKAGGRRVDFIHMPVIKHPDEAFFAPLIDLAVGETKVFLGLIHHTDGVDGFRTRLELARRCLDDFGVASVCGFGRNDPAELSTILAVHRECAALLPSIKA